MTFSFFTIISCCSFSILLYFFFSVLITFLYPIIFIFVELLFTVMAFKLVFLNHIISLHKMTQGKAHSQNFKCFHKSHALNPCLGKTKSNIIELNQTVVHHTSETKNRLQVNYRWTYKGQVLKYTVKDRKGWSRTRKVGSPWGVRDQSLLGRREAGHPTVPPEKGQCWNLS